MMGFILRHTGVGAGSRPRQDRQPGLPETIDTAKCHKGTSTFRDWKQVLPSFAGAAALQPKLFATAVACLEEGHPEARACGRRMLHLLHDDIMKFADFQELLNMLTQNLNMKVQKVCFESD